MNLECQIRTDLPTFQSGPQNRTAKMLTELGETEQAIKAGQRGVDLYQQLVRDQLDRGAYRHGLAISLNSLAIALRTTRRAGEALVALRRVVKILEGQIRAEPSDADTADALALEWSNLAKVLDNLGRTEEAHALLARDRAHLEDLVRRTPGAVRPRSMVFKVASQRGATWLRSDMLRA
jgi:tetratricopeptide (TPR) repeat protein